MSNPATASHHGPAHRTHDHRTRGADGVSDGHPHHRAGRPNRDRTRSGLPQRSGLWPVTRLMFRRHRVALVAWVLPLLLLVAVTVPSYQSTYPQLAQRAPLVAQMQNTDGMRLLYGVLRDPGTLGQLFTWEVGAYVVILTCVMSVLLAVSTTRGEEEAGTLELVRASGVKPAAALGAAMILVFTACLLVGAGSTLVLLVQMATQQQGGTTGEMVADELTAAGSIGFGAMTSLTGTAVGLVTMIFAQLRQEARGVRSWAFIFLGVAFGMRIAADQAIFEADWPQWLKALNWISPLGWREAVSPFSEDRLWALGVFAAVCVTLGSIVFTLYGRREYAASLLPDRSSSTRGMHVQSVEAWGWRAGRGQVVGWSVATLLVSALFGSMTAGLVQTLQDSEPTRRLLQQMTANQMPPDQVSSGRDSPGANADGGVAAAVQPGVEASDLAAAADALEPANLLAQFYEFLGLYVALLVAVFAIGAVLKWRGEEKAGHLDLELTAGTKRWRSLLARCTVAAVCSITLLAASAALMGWLGEAQMSDQVGSGEAFRHSMAATFGQAPAVLAGIGLAAMLVAVIPRSSGVVWVIVAVSGFLHTFGALVDLPGWVRDLGLYGWAPELGQDWPWGPMVTLVGIGVVGVCLGSGLVGRRDVATG